MEILLDENVTSDQDSLALGIEPVTSYNHGPTHEFVTESGPHQEPFSG